MRPQPRVREAVESDVDSLQSLYSSIRSTASWLPVDARATSDFVRDSEGERILVSISHEGQIEGFISIWEADAFVHHLYVRPQSRRKGVARGLLVSALHRIPLPWQLKCLRANSEAMRFYASAGCIEVGAGEGPEGAYAVLQLNARSIAL
jgi:GNAT superfamily N-acetyltransferase